MIFSVRSLAREDGHAHRGGHAGTFGSLRQALDQRPGEWRRAGRLCAGREARDWVYSSYEASVTATKEHTA